MSIAKQKRLERKSKKPVYADPTSDLEPEPAAEPVSSKPIEILLPEGDDAEPSE